MQRNMGMERLLGAGGGTISEDSMNNLRIAEDLCRKRRPVEAVPYLEKAMRDPRNLDALVQLAFLAPNLEESTNVLLNAERQGKRLLKQDLGPKCFDDDGDAVGNFWLTLETRPYMRTLQALVRIHEENKQYGKAAEVIIEMLRLCPRDNLGQRWSLGTALIKAKRYSDALSFSQAWINLGGSGDSPPKGGCAFEAPSTVPLTEAELESLSECENSAMAYSAALATFRLCGDCELARQYLFYAASLNPHVLLKVLGKVERPKGLNNLPRESNGTEEAHDYLWASQDLWMADDVWSWADRQPEVKALVLKKCSRAECDKRESRVAQFKRCGSCHLVFYCGTNCQKADWQAHKPECQRRAQMKSMFRSMQTA